MRSPAAFAILMFLANAADARSLSIAEAIRSAWQHNEGLRSSASGVAAARADAARARDARLPTLSLAARGIRTDEPMMAFGTALNQGQIGVADLDPRRLNDPAAIGGFGASASLSVPLFLGGRLAAGRRAAAATAESEAAMHAWRRDAMALSVVEAYFGAQAAAEALRHAEELVAHALETERLVRERNSEGLALDADAARATAFRAQAEANRVAALQRRASAHAGLALLVGLDAADLELVTPVDGLPASPGSVARTEQRSDLEAARSQRQAAEAAVEGARGALLPTLFAQASAETLRTSDLSHGSSWVALGLVLRWDVSVGDLRARSAAESRAEAAHDALIWQERQARREVDEARAAIATADARVRSAQEAVAASESARTLRFARHREGLLPLTDVLDAEAGLAGARALLLASRLEARLARARLALVTNQRIEGVEP